ncbi:MAG: putative sulfate/molybdate transporter [Halolamina sp.]
MTYWAGREISFEFSELTGALGDSVTVLPIVVGLGALTEASLAHMLLAFGAFQILWGMAYGFPISVEPMKALAGLAIAGTLGYGELVAAGLLAGVVLLVGARLGLLSALAEHVPESVVRGVQLAVALVLARTGLSLSAGDPAVALAAAAAGVALAVLASRGVAALAVLVGGGLVAAPAPSVASAPALTPSLFPVGGPTLTAGVIGATGAQLAMTVGNAAVATSLLCSDLYDADVSPDRLADSMGITCLVAVPLGGVPMCHGSGGVAGKHAFGARTAGANVILGGLYVGAAAVAGTVAGFPMAVLGALLGFVALELGDAARETNAPWLTVAVGVVGLAWNVGAAFLLGTAVVLAVRRVAPGR